ncbi:MAG: outer membrane protein assembly factor BamE [Caulobacteraceae bacterium]
MRTSPVAAAAAALLLPVVVGCTPVNSYQGFQVVEQAPADLKVGEDTRSTVMAKLGSPTATSTFDKDTWFYLSQATNKTGFYRPRVTRRDIVAVDFDKTSQQVTAVRVYGLKDSRLVAYNSRQTPTRGREITVLEQLIGSISAASALPQDQNQTPGSHPDDPR